MNHQISYAQFYQFLREQKKQLSFRKEKLLEVTDVNADTYLSSCKDHNTYAYYINNIHRGSRSRVSLIQTSTSQLIPLAVNTANIFLLEDICTMLEMIKAALREAPASGSRYEKKILENRGMMSLLYQHKQQEQEVWIRKWEETKFPENPSHPENRIVPSVLGMVRSKSEAHLVNKLYEMGIVEKYEAPLFLGRDTIYPDVTAIDPRTGRFIYFEHMGMIDNNDYFNAALKRLALYQRNHIYLNVNLFVFTETKDNPCDFQWMDKVLEHIFTMPLQE